MSGCITATTSPSSATQVVGTCRAESGEFQAGARRRVWRKAAVLAWIAEQEELARTGEAA